MKDGAIVEQGSHQARILNCPLVFILTLLYFTLQELLAADGEYASLYNVQARAFAPPSTSGDTEPEGDDWSVSEEGWQQSHPHLNMQPLLKPALLSPAVTIQLP